MAARSQILFLTNSEYGQANVFIAVSHELLVRGNCDVHIASFSPLAKRVDELRDGGFGFFDPESGSVTFHLLSGMSMHEARLKKFGIPSIDHAPGVRPAVKVYEKLTVLAKSRTGAEYIQGCREMKKVISKVNPDAIAVEEYFHQGMDACTSLNKEYIILGPGTFREHSSSLESLWMKMTKYPAKGSGHPYPLPRSRLPANLYLNLRLISKFVKSAHSNPIMKARKEEGLRNRHPGLRPYDPDITYLLPSTPESDFPCPLPPNIICCGPIIVPSAPLSVVDPDLNAWLRARPTVLLSLGSFLRIDEKHAQGLASGIRILLDKNCNIQVLWKLKTEESLYDTVLHVATKMLAEHVDSTRVRIEKWLKAQPAEIVRQESVVCSVHHGGASSFFEALSAGVPQIVLPCWWDTYEFAARVEYLGIGVYGSRESKSAPKADGIEFGEALQALNDDGNEKTKLIRNKAKKMAEICNAYGGRGKAAGTILELASKNSQNG